MWWPIYSRITGNIFFQWKIIFRGPTRGVKSKKKENFKVVGILCCVYSKLVSGDAWPNAKGISSIGPTCWEKTSKTCQNIGIFWRLPKSAKLNHILVVFSWQGDQIELIPFALFQASSDTSLEYPQRIILRTLKFLFFVGGKKWFPVVLLYIGQHIRYLRIWY